MASVTFFINDGTTVEQNTVVTAAEQSANVDTYDYVISINLTDVNTLFNTRTYIEHQSSPNEFNVDLSVNVDSLNSAFDAVTIANGNADVGTNSAYGSLVLTAESVGQKFIEIMATKIFGNATAVAAIINDTDFTAGSLRSQLASDIANAFVNKGNDIFNQYVASNRYEDRANDDNSTQDRNTAVDFNFADANIELPVFLTGTLKIDAGVIDLATAVSFAQDLANGPDVGGNQLVSGSYNVPILFRFHA